MGMRQIPLSERFWSYVQVNALHECWPWIGPTDRKGYGQVWVRDSQIVWADDSGDRQRIASRVMFAMTRGRWPNGFVCHSCDNPPCVNPFHLWEGSALDNMQDMIQKGRQKQPPRLLGESHPRHKLTDAQVAEIRARHRPGARKGDPASTFNLAVEFGVSKTLVKKILSGERRCTRLG